MVIFPLAPDQTIAQMWSNGARGGMTLTTWTCITVSIKQHDINKAHYQRSVTVQYDMQNIALTSTVTKLQWNTVGCFHLYCRKTMKQVVYN